MYVLKAWDHDDRTMLESCFRTEKIHISSPKVDVGTNNYILEVFLIGDLINCMYPVYVSTGGFHCLFSLRVPTACSHCMYSLYVFMVCIQCMYSLYVFITCIHCIVSIVL